MTVEQEIASMMPPATLLELALPSQDLNWLRSLRMLTGNTGK